MTIQWDPIASFKDVASGRTEDPAPAYGALLDERTVAQYDAGFGMPIWGIFGHDEVEKAAIDTKTFSSVTVPPDSPRILPLMADPPEQTGYRRMMNPFFKASQISETESAVRPIAIEIIDSIVARGSADFAQEFAYPFSTQVLCKFLHVKDAWQIYNDWSAEMERLTGAGTAKPGSKLPIEHFQAVVPYLQDLITDRRANPGTDAVSGIIAGEINGQPLDDQAVTGLLIALILAGRSTTASGIGNLVLRLARHQELQDDLRAHPERIPDAVEESLRMEAPQQQQPRRATRDVEVGGQLIQAGQAVFLNFGSANVDGRYWDKPETFDIDRKSKQHFAFGRGVHQCFGAPLGRMEIRVSVEELLARTASFALDGEVTRLTWPRLSVETLPIRVVPA